MSTPAKKTSFGEKLLGFVILAGVLYGVGSCYNWASETNRASSDRRADRESSLLLLMVHDLQWRAGGFGSVMIVNFTLENLLPHAAKDLRLACQVQGASGTVIAQPSTTIYEIFPSEKKRRIKDLSVGFIPSQAKTASCKIAGYTPA